MYTVVLTDGTGNDLVTDIILLSFILN